ncbi:hypothetical protein CQR46_0956 [Bifidobacterium pseudolongum subsp. globosum]|uniref:HK97 gp10 family phage protein n=1 Tax=Bifidobacterium pseudolongum subsp. globosum TaxID=1690 RepID=A0A2N3QHN3_9BIFI|nr:hypothetical protein [Bifidobacterium pseudolongum]PKU90760.1 hypothetical protein CQR46_0956 [Bifidobacterium pseudolongum subsp. globosum]
MSHVEIDPDWIEQQVLQNPALTEALEAGARRLAPIVKAVAIKDGDQRYADSVRITQGVRPGAKSPIGIRRPYSRVIVGDPDATAKEYGGRLPKKGFLRRAVAQWNA